jgi:hypothetical protein
MPSKINPTQNLMLDLITKASFNDFDGKAVVDDLMNHQELWCSVMMTREGMCGITLRDLPDGDYNVDTLYILSSGKDDNHLLAVAEGWPSDEVSWLSDDAAGKFLGCFPATGRVLRLWWD